MRYTLYDPLKGFSFKKSGNRIYLIDFSWILKPKDNFTSNELVSTLYDNLQNRVYIILKKDVKICRFEYLSPRISH